MTPLAHRLVRKWLEEAPITLEPRASLFWKAFNKSLPHLHCFECSEITQLAGQIGRDMLDKHSADERVSFLPFPVTWIEYGDVLTHVRTIHNEDIAGEVAATKFSRLGFLCLQNEQDGKGILAFVVALNEQTGDIAIAPGFINLPAMNNPQLGHTYTISREVVDLEKTLGADVVRSGTSFSVLSVYSMLAVINSPKIVERDQHSAHRGLEKAVRASRAATDGAQRSFAFQPWHKIRLALHMPKEGGGTERVAGKRALHWVRMHPRIRLGRLEWVRPHQRGSAEVGVSRAYYEVKP